MLRLEALIRFRGTLWSPRLCCFYTENLKLVTAHWLQIPVCSRPGGPERQPQTPPTMTSTASQSRPSITLRQTVAADLRPLKSKSSLSARLGSSSRSSMVPRTVRSASQLPACGRYTIIQSFRGILRHRFKGRSRENVIETASNNSKSILTWDCSLSDEARVSFIYGF